MRNRHFALTKLPMDDEPLHGGNGSGSLSARYLSQPQRLVGCSLPPLVPGVSVTTSTRGFATLAVPHILESAATTQSLPEASLVRFRWKHEASQRGSLFQPVKITNAPGILSRRRRTATLRHERETAANAHGGAWSRDDDGDEEEEEETKQHDQSHASSARSIEMVYPICVDAQGFVEYLRDMNELVLDVIDRSTRRKYGKCVVPLFTTSAASSDGNSRSSQKSKTAVEHVLRQLRRDNALYEIKSLEPDQDDDMIGYLAIKLDVQFREVDDEALARLVQAPLPSQSMESPVSPPAPVLVPRTNPTVQVNVRQNIQTRRIQHNDGGIFRFGDLSRVSYLESDAFRTLHGSSPGSESMMSSMSSVLRYSEKVTHAGNDSPLQYSKLQHLIEKGKALQKSMTEATKEENDGWGAHQYPVMTSASAHLDGVQEIVDAVSYEDSSGNASDHDPCSWQSILKQTQMPSEMVEPRTVYSKLVTSGAATRLPSANDAQGLKIGFEAVKFTSGFIDQLQQMRDSAISSRFSPIEMAVSHTDVGALLAPTAEDDTTSQVERTESLFTITPSLRKRAFRLTFSHIAPLQVGGGSPISSLQWRSSKEQLRFYVTCRTQGTPRRHQLGSRHDKKSQILLRGAVPVRDIPFDRETSSDPQAANVSLFVHPEEVTAAHRTRKLEKAHKVGVMKITFQPCRIKAENREFDEMKGESHLIYSPPAEGSHEWSRQRARSPIPTRELKRKETKRRMHSRRDDALRNPAPGPMITSQLAVMIDKASSICSSEARLRRVPLGESVLRFLYAIPPSGSASKVAQPIGSFKRSFRRKLIRGPEGRAREFFANVGHIGVFPLDTDDLVARDFKKRLLIIEVWLQGQQHAQDDEGELLGLVKIPFTGFASCFRESSSDWKLPIPFMGVDKQFPIEDPFSGQVSGFLQIRVAVGTAEQIIALDSTVRAITRLQAIVRGALSRKANLPHHRAMSSGSVDRNPIQHPGSNSLSDNEGEFDQDNHSEDAESIPSGESLEVPRNPIDNEMESHIIQPSDPTQGGENSLSSSIAAASFSTTRRLLPAKITMSIQVLSVTDLMHAIEEKWSQVCASASKLELKKHLEGLLTDGVITAILECDFCLGVEIEETTEARSMERNGATSRLYKKSGRWYKHLRFPATQCAVMNSKQLLQMRSPLQVQVVVHPEVIQIIQDECLGIRILSWCPRSNAEYHIGTVSVPIAAVLFRPSGVQGAFSIAIGDVLSGRLGVQVQIERQPGALTSDRVLLSPALAEREQEQTLAQSTADQPSSPTRPDDFATNQFSANHDDKLQLREVTEEDYRDWYNEGDDVDEQGVFPSSGAGPHDVPGHHETESIASNLDQYSGSGGDFLAAQSAVSVEDDVSNSYSSWHVIGDAGEPRWSGDHFVTEERSSVVGQDDVQDDDFTPLALDDTADYYKPITLASLGIEELELSPLSDRMSPSARYPDNEQLFAAQTSYAEPNTLLQQDDRQVEEVESPAASQIAPLTTDDMKGEVVENLTSAAVMPQQDETSRRLDTDVEGDRAAAEEATYECEPDEVPVSSDHQALEELGTADRASSFSTDGEHDAPHGCCTLTEQPHDETRSLVSGYADHGTDNSAKDHTDVTAEPASTSSLELYDPSHAYASCTDSAEMSTVDDGNGLGSSTQLGELRESSAETDAIVSEEKAVQVNMESCDVMEGSSCDDMKDATEDLERVSAGVDQAHRTSSTLVELADQVPVPGNPLQPEHLADKSTAKGMVDAACGTDDDFGFISEFESNHDSDVEQSLHADPHREDLEVKDGFLEILTPPSSTTVGADDKITPPSSGDGSVELAQEPQTAQQGQEQLLPTQSSFSLPADKFELICQLLTEIRDSCGSGLVKEILRAHNARVTQNSSPTEQIRVDEHPTKHQDEEVTVQATSNKADAELHNLPRFTGMESREGEISTSLRFRQSSSTESAVDLESARAYAHHDADHQYHGRVDAPDSRRHSPAHVFKRDLKAVHWTDSFTLQQEMQRRMKTCDDDQNSRERAVERMTAARTSPRPDAKLFGDEVEAPLFAFSTRQVKKPLPFKADSETERIARIMQGSVNYWRKGDEHALTSDDDSVDSDDDDWCF